MIKQKISPLYFQYDIINSEMPAVFLDPTCKIKIYLYETNQVFDEIFLDETDPSIRLVEYKLHSTLDAWVAQNFTKQINPFQNSSAAKTIAMQTEIELYILKKINSLIEKKFYFFTFEPVNDNNIHSVNKYLIKENIDNLDKNTFRFSKIKAWLLSSVLIKNFQYWKFLKSAGDLGRKKIKRIKITVPSYAGIGNIRIEGNNRIGETPQEVDYRVYNISHPFRALEPIAINFAYRNQNLYSQLIHWDWFGKAQQHIRNKVYSIGDLNKWGTMDFSVYSYGSVAYQAGAVMNSAPTGNQTGLAELYCWDMKDKKNDLKQYMWAKESYWNRNQREYWNLKKTRSTSNIQFLEEFLKSSNVTQNFQPWWNPDYDVESLGPLFYTFTMAVMNNDNFNPGNETIDLPDANGNYCWVLCGEINFYDTGIFKKRTSNENTLLNPEYYNFGVFPLGFISPLKMRSILDACRYNKSLNEITITLNLNQPTYLNNVKIDIIYVNDIKIELVDEANRMSSYETKTNFYLVGQDKISTKINFY